MTVSALKHNPVSEGGRDWSTCRLRRYSPELCYCQWWMVLISIQHLWISYCFLGHQVISVKRCTEWSTARLCPSHLRPCASRPKHKATSHFFQRSCSTQRARRVNRSSQGAVAGREVLLQGSGGGSAQMLLKCRCHSFKMNISKYQWMSPFFKKET